MELVDLLRLTIEQKASDLHIVAGVPPILRIDGDVQKTNYPSLVPDDTRRLMYSLLTDAQKAAVTQEEGWILGI